MDPELFRADQCERGLDRGLGVEQVGAQVAIEVGRALGMHDVEAPGKRAGEIVAAMDAMEVAMMAGPAFERIGVAEVGGTSPC